MDGSNADWYGKWSLALTRSHAENTVAAYLGDADDFSAWFEDVNGTPLTSLAMITGHDLRAYRKDLRARRLAAATVNRRIEALRSLLGWAHLTGQISTSPDVLFRGVKRVRSAVSTPRWLNEQEYHRVARLIEQAANTGIPVGSTQKQATEHSRAVAVRDRAMIALMLYAGLRVSEVASLRIGDVEIGQRSGRVRVYAGKGDKDRTVLLGAEARLALGCWLDMRPDVLGDDPVFIGRGGVALSVTGIQKRVRALGRVAGVELTPHKLRHTFARRFIVANRERLGDDALMVLARLMGHERLETTRRYAQPGEDDILDALDGM